MFSLCSFVPEKRLAGSGMAMFLLALAGVLALETASQRCGLDPAAFCRDPGIDSVSPAWDAGVRPYAASVPVQSFLAAAGFSMLLDLLRRLAEVFVTACQRRSCGRHHGAGGDSGDQIGEEMGSPRRLFCALFYSCYTGPNDAETGRLPSPGSAENRFAPGFLASGFPRRTDARHVSHPREVFDRTVDFSGPHTRTRHGTSPTGLRIFWWLSIRSNLERS